MELIKVYSFLAILVAAMATIDLYRPVIQKFDMSLDLRSLYYLVCFILSILVAPVLVYPCISKIAGLEFRNAFEDTVFDKSYEKR